MRLLIFLTSLTILACESSPKSETNQYGQVILDSHDDVMNLITDLNIKSVDRLVEAIKPSFSSSVLVYNSLSRHVASPVSPRVISYSDYGNLIVTWDENSNFLETVTFNEDDDAFDFREILFDAEGAKISQKNRGVGGESCLGCHQPGMKPGDAEDPRPNWDPYPNWIGSYGSQFDSFFTTDHYDFDNKTMEFLDGAVKNFSQEPENLAAFHKKAKTHNRYKHLPVFPDYDIKTMDTETFVFLISFNVLPLTNLLKFKNMKRQGRMMRVGSDATG